MMMTGKQRAALRSMANTLDVVLYVGKEGITPHTIKEAYDVLESRELIKCAVQQGAPVDAKTACAEICAQTGAEFIQCIGRRFVIYRESREHKTIDLKNI